MEGTTQRPLTALLKAQCSPCGLSHYQLSTFNGKVWDIGLSGFTKPTYARTSLTEHLQPEILTPRALPGSRSLESESTTVSLIQPLVFSLLDLWAARGEVQTCVFLCIPVTALSRLWKGHRDSCPVSAGKAPSAAGTLKSQQFRLV